MLPTAEDFEVKRLLGDTSEFDTALSNVQAKFNAILTEKYAEAAEEQNRLSDRIKSIDKQASEATVTVSATAKSSYSKLQDSIKDLEIQLNRVSSLVSGIVDDLYDIDQRLPTQEQLLAPSLPNKAQFPGLTSLMLEKQLLKPVKVQGVVAETELAPQSAQAAMLQEDADYVRAKLRSFQTH